MSDMASGEIDGEASRDALRSRIVSAAAELVATGGRQALTTRSVAARAGVQAPTIYRLFGDKDGLADAVAEHGYAAYLTHKQLHPHEGDPVQDLKDGWDLHVGFGLANPGLYELMYAEARTGGGSSAAERAWDMLREHVRRVAAAGRLRVSEERAVGMIHAAARGTVLTLLATPEGERDPGLSDAARDAILAGITVDRPVVDEPGPHAAAIALRACIPDVTSLSGSELGLLREWLDRLSEGSDDGRASADSNG